MQSTGFGDCQQWLNVFSRLCTTRKANEKYRMGIGRVGLETGWRWQ
jgi:hypothetical protein